MSAPRSSTELTDFFAAVAERLPLHELIRESIPLRRSGASFRGPCPWHDGKNPNFSVSPHVDGFFCFVCGVSGGYLRWIADRLGIADKREAMQYLSQRTGVPLPPSRLANALVEEQSAAEIARRRDALYFAYKLYRQARTARAEEFREACVAAGWDPDWEGLAGVGFAPAGDKLSANVQKRTPAHTWASFRAVELIGFDGEPGSAESIKTMHDCFPPGLIWPVVDRELLLGLAQLDPQSGRRLLCTQAIGRLRDPRQGSLLAGAAEARLILAPRAQPGSGEPRTSAGGASVPPGRQDDTKANDSPASDSPVQCLVWANAADYFQLGPVLSNATGLSPRVRHVVPVGEWRMEDAAGVRGLRAQLAGDDRPAGIVTARAGIGFWSQAAWLELSGAVLSFDARRATCEHVFEYALREEPTYDPSDAIEAMIPPSLPRPGRAASPPQLSPRVLALRGWWRRLEAARREARSAASAALVEGSGQRVVRTPEGPWEDGHTDAGVMAGDGVA